MQYVDNSDLPELLPERTGVGAIRRQVVGRPVPTKDEKPVTTKDNCSCFGQCNRVRE
jgi:hypothetical protein